MRIRVLSDLHLEFHWDTFRSFISSLDPEGVDVLVLAGDICLGWQIVDVLTSFCQRFAESDVVFIHGNHEFYCSDRPTVIAYTQEALRQNKNLHWLDCSAEVIRGQRFAGATLWFEDDPMNLRLENFMNDFHIIKDLKQWVYLENLRAMNFIEGSIDENDVVVTHHLPSNMSVSPRFRSGDLNRFFVCDMEQFIRRRGPKLWIHGHTHDSKDFVIEHSGNISGRQTRVVCNPRGYWPSDLNPEFDLEKNIDI